jgi:hypothetical protein
MRQTGYTLLAGLAAATTIGFAPAASAQAPHPSAGMHHPAGHPGVVRPWHRHHRAYAPVPARYGYSWRPGYGWYVSWRTRLPARAGFVVAGGPVPPGAYGPVGYATPYQDGTIYADDARRVYAYPTYVYPAAAVSYYGTGCLGIAGCSPIGPFWR